MYKYELHCHTSEISRCGRISASDMIDFYKEEDYTGVVITDHFFNGNCAVPQDLDWKTRVDMFCEGYKRAKERADKIGIDVFFSWESSYKGNDFLTYGLDSQWLYENENCDRLSIHDYCDLVHKSGGFIIHAHPFCEAQHVEMIRLVPRKVDAVEAFNASRPDSENEMANFYADHYNLPKSCGSDNHVGKKPCLAALELDFKAKSTAEIARAILDGKSEIKKIVFED